MWEAELMEDLNPDSVEDDVPRFPAPRRTHRIETPPGGPGRLYNHRSSQRGKPLRFPLSSYAREHHDKELDKQEQLRLRACQATR